MMKKLICSILSLSTLFFSAPVFGADAHPVGIDKTSGQQRVLSNLTLEDIAGSTVVNANRTALLVYNMRISYASGLFKVVGFDGNDLSATNKGIVVAYNNSGTGFNVLEFTSSPSFQDDAHASDSDFVGTGTMSWGTTAAVAWGNDLPILIGVGTDGTTPVMFLARGPVSTTGAASNIGYHDNAPSAASQNNVFALTGSNVTASHANQKITWIGAIRMTKSNVDDWTVAALDSGDGVLNFYNLGIREYDMPTGQMGATSGKHFADNGGVAPTYTNAATYYKFRCDLQGEITISANHVNSAGGTAGSGSFRLQMAVPYAAKTGMSSPFGVGACFESGGTNVYTSVEFTSSGSSLAQFAYQSVIGTSTTGVNNVDQSSASRQVSTYSKYKAF